MEKVDFVVIGAGLFGSMIAKHLTKNGMDVIVIDNKEPLAASKCSFGIYKEGWIAKIQKEVEYGMGIISQHTEVGTRDFFDMNREEEIQMNWIDCDELLLNYFNNERVKKIKNNLVITDKDKYLGKYGVVIAAGVWTPILLAKSKYPTFYIDQYWGATLDVEMKIDTSRIHQWAPYKQSVLLKKSKKLFVFGDGATVKNPKPDDPRNAKVGSRLVEHLGQTTQANIDSDKITAVKEGLRPYLPKGDTRYVKKHDKKLWSATGGAKNSTVLCGYVARVLLEEVEKQNHQS